MLKNMSVVHKDKVLSYVRGHYSVQFGASPDIFLQNVSSNAIYLTNISTF